MPETVECDLLVIGSGASGFAAAITAKINGLSSIIVEKSDVFGGTSATSGGHLWIPCTSLARAAGIADSEQAAMEYIRNESKNAFDRDVTAAFLKHGPAMVDFFQHKTEVEFLLNPSFPDYHSELPGGSKGGRTIWTAPYRGTALGPLMKQLRTPLREFSFLGTGVSKRDLWHFFHVTSSLTSAVTVARLLLTLAWDRLRFGRSMRLVNGSALIARLARTSQTENIPIWLSSPAEELIVEEGAISGARVRRQGSLVEVRAGKGVVLACGGFPHDVRRRQRLYRHPAGEGQHFSLASETNTGDGLAMGERAGAAIEESLSNAAYWMPVSEVPWKDGTRGHFPHTGGVDRSMPGFIIVDASGRRFANESTNYHDFLQAMVGAAAGKPVKAHIVCDSRAIRKYGLGMVRPFPIPLGRHIRSGYLKTGRSLDELAGRIGVPAATLAETVGRFNRDAERGEDPDFGRGSHHYDRYYGDSEHRPSPSLAPLVKAPFYAIAIGPGDVGTLAGLKTDGFARVLRADGSAIPGLYAAGNDMASLFGGNVSGGGITLGPGMTFGYVAALHAAGRL